MVKDSLKIVNLHFIQTNLQGRLEVLYDLWVLCDSLDNLVMVQITVTIVHFNKRDLVEVGDGWKQLLGKVIVLPQLNEKLEFSTLAKVD